MLGDVYALNTVIDDNCRLVYATVSEVIASQLAATDFVKRFAQISVGRNFHTIVTSSAGYPLDQTVKGMVTPLDILEPGGILIVILECAEGIGSEHYRVAQERLVALGPDAFLETLLVK